MSGTVADPAGVAGTVRPRPATAPAPAARRRGVTAINAAAILAWLVVAAFAVAGRGPFAAPTAPAASTDAVPGVAGFAELFVVVWLGEAGEGSEQALAPFYGGDVDLRGVVPGRRYVSRAAAVEIRPDTAGWAVTVVADVLQATDDGWRDGGRRYYRVGVLDDGGRLAAAALPAEVPPPRASATPAAPALTEPTAGPVTDAVARVVRAVLTGDGDVTDLLAPGAALPTFDAPPYHRVSLRGVHTDTRRGVAVAEVAATDVRGNVTVLHYAVRVRIDDGVTVSGLAPVTPDVARMAGG
ncbi:MAG: conjugal transfer protein [Actinobacteria bacterium]|nr:conjugal transfer protein [Actinomycetota bacterium]